MANQDNEKDTDNSNRGFAGRRNNARLQAKAGELLMHVVMPMNLLQKKLAKLVHAAT